MIDTLVIRVHGREKYTDFMQYLLQYPSAVLRKQGLIIDPGDFRLNVSMVQFNDNLRRTYTLNGKVMTSSHYSVAFFAPEGADYVELNVSIPKAVHGTNIMQFVPHPWETHERFPAYTYGNKQAIQDVAYDRLRPFIERFFHRYFTQHNVEPEDIEIRRMDICFNQIFHSKKEALTMLEYQKRLRKSRLRPNAANMCDWATSVFYKSERYSCKIYHKGTEYQSSKGEKKEHQKANERHKSELFKIDDLQDLADRTLRYEMTIRNGYMSYLFCKNLFRKKCPIHAVLVDKAKEADNKKRRYERDRKLEDRLTPYEWKVLKWYQSALTRRVKFFLEVSDKTKRYNSETVGLKTRALALASHESDLMQFSDNTNKTKEGFTFHNKARFNRALYDCMCRQFWKFFDEFQVSEATTLEEFDNALVEYNNCVDMMYDSDGLKNKAKRIKPGPFLQIAALLQKNGFSWDELAIQLKWSRSTLWRWRKKLEKLGWSKEKVSTVKIAASKDFQAYFFAVVYQGVMPQFNIYFK
jgi:hypothetical protein